MNTINNTSQINGYYDISQIQLQKLLEEQRQQQDKKQEGDSIQISQQAGNMLAGGIQAPQFNFNILDSLVEDGTLTQDQADAVKSAFESNRISNQNKNTLTYGSQGNMISPTTPFDSLISSEIITDEQKNSIQNALLSSIQQNTSNEDIRRGTNPLDDLVDNGTLTQEQEDEIIKSLGNSRDEESISDILSQLVEDGIITDEQSQLSKSTLLSALASKKEDEEVAINPLDALVEDGTITKEIKDEIIKNMGKPAPPKPKEDDEEEEDSSTNGISTSAQKNYLDGLVKSGIITQAQEDKILEALEG